MEIPEGHASSSPVTASDKKGLKKSASISSTNKSEDALTNPALYHAAGTSYFRLFHLGKNHQLRQNNDKFKIGYGHVCEFMAPDAVSTTIRVGNALIDACSEVGLVSS